MIYDVRIFKSELKLYNYYKTQLKQLNDELRDTYYPSNKSFTATEDYIVYQNNKFISKSWIPIKRPLTKNEMLEIEYNIYEIRKRLNTIITSYTNKIKDIDDTLKILPKELKDMVVDVYINGNSIKYVSYKYGYSMNGFIKYVNSNLKKLLKN